MPDPMRLKCIEIWLFVRPVAMSFLMVLISAAPSRLGELFGDVAERNCPGLVEEGWLEGLPCARASARARRACVSLIIPSSCRCLGCKNVSIIYHILLSYSYRLLLIPELRES
jgi:hypothetical protein